MCGLMSHEFVQKARSAFFKILCVHLKRKVVKTYNIDVP